MLDQSANGKGTSLLEQYDLHLHTTWSDGSTPMPELLCCAAARGLAGVAITDHDSFEMSVQAASAVEHLGISLAVIPGAELSCYDPQTGRKVHLLVYAPQDTDELENHCATMAERRRVVGQEMIAQLCKHYPVRRERILELAAQSKTIYRVHLVQALCELGFGNTIYGPLYQELFGKPDGICLRSVEYPDVFEAARMARRSGGAVVLAHPGVYRSFAVAHQLAQQGLLDGLEYRYPRRKEEELALHDELLQRYGLVSTGGTDFHGSFATTPHPVGSCTTSCEELTRLFPHYRVQERFPLRGEG